MVRNQWIGVGFGGAAIAVAATTWVLIYVGAYNVAADEPHYDLVYRLLNVVRERSVIVRSEKLFAPPDFSDAKSIVVGAGLYNEMCSGCHLAPGMERTEISQGLYPKAPELSRGSNLTPEQEFWVIKHGLKMTAMAAWGQTHNDTLIWDMVAFLRMLPSLSPAEYQAAVKSAPEDHDQTMHDMHMNNDTSTTPRK